MRVALWSVRQCFRINVNNMWVTNYHRNGCKSGCWTTCWSFRVFKVRDVTTNIFKGIRHILRTILIVFRPTKTWQEVVRQQIPNTVELRGNNEGANTVRACQSFSLIYTHKHCTVDWFTKLIWSPRKLQCLDSITSPLCCTILKGYECEKINMQVSHEMIYVHIFYQVFLQ